MFYSQFILAKKGPLGTIWIAAHLERKLRKNQVADTNIGDSVDSILFPDVPIALRLSSHLLLGVVRIYSRKVNYLFDDCSEALLKIKQAFRSTAVDLPPEESKAPYHSITLPETFDLDDFELPDNDIFQGNDHHVSTKEQITLQDTVTGVYSTSQFGLDERFGDGDTSQVGLDLEEDLLLGNVAASGLGDISESNPQASVEAVAFMETDANDDEIAVSTEDMPVNGTRNKNEGLTSTSELVEYAQAPSTPVLGEPNLLSACDDNVESEYHNTTELVGTEGKHDTSGKLNHQHMDDVAAHLNHDTDVCMVAEENGYQGHLKSMETTGAIQANGTDDILDGSGKVEDKVNGANKPSMPSDQILGECVGSKEGRLSQTDEVKVGNEIEQSHSQGEAGSQLKLPNASEHADVDGQLHLDPGNFETLSNHFDNEHAASDGVAVLIACNSQATCPGVSSYEADNPEVPSELPSEQGPPAAGVSSKLQDIQSEENQILESMNNGQIEADDGKLEEHLDKAISTANQLECPNTSEIAELPEPEKLLSVPQGDFDNADELLVEPEKEKETTSEVDGNHASNKVSGRKRNLQDSSLATPSLTSVESFGTKRLKRTVDSIPDDDDLLSSILVGRKSSVLKMKPTPPVPDEVSMKRGRSASRSSAMKRKVPMDDSMVLHGDTIRQQLINTEDIRRLRKKAPCTLIEVLLIQRQFLEEEIFNEPVLTGVAAEITCLHNKTVDFNRVRISENVDSNTPLEPSKDKECYSTPIAAQCTEMEVSTQPVNCGDDVAGFDRTFIQTGNLQDINRTLGASVMCNLGSINSNGNKDDHETMDEALPCITEAETDGKAELADAANPSVVPRGDTSETEPLCEDISNLPADSLAHTAVSNQYNDADGLTTQSDDVNLQSMEVVVDKDMSDIGKAVGDADGLNKDIENSEKVETLLRAEAGILLEESNIDGIIELGVDAQVIREQADACHDNATGGIDNQIVVNVDQAQEFIGNDKLEVCNDDDGLALRSVLHDDEEQIPSYLCDYSGGHDGDFKNASLADSDYPLYDQESNMDAHVTSFVQVGEEIQDFAFANDTEFLNDEDGDADDENDDGMPNVEETHLLDNSGWSGRTRAVSKYLQTQFDDQVGCGRKVLPMDNLLAGKTRKEAARMFFETLVLKTKDYIHVEQPNPFDNINIKPTAKLMKSEF